MVDAGAVDLARLHTARAAAIQSGDANAAERDLVKAAELYARVGRMSDAAALAAGAATFAELAGDLPRAVDHAVGATIQLADVDMEDTQSALAASSLCAFYGHMGAFELAIPFGRRAGKAAVHLDGMQRAAAFYNHAYVSVEAAHAAVTETDREQHLNEAWRLARWMLDDGADDSVNRILGSGLAAEVLLARGDLDGAATVMETAADAGSTAGPTFRPWFDFVTASVRFGLGELEDAERLLTEAIPGLEATSDDHCLIRALATRSAVREARGDTAGALADARRQAALVRAWHVERTTQFATLIASQAELERDGSMLRRQAGELARAATEDALTGLYSRRWLMRRLGELETLDQTGAVLMVDIDHFKVVNDTHGHSVGDQVLTAVSSVLRGSMRDGDVVRYGGEEFLVAITTDLPTAIAIAERARVAVALASFDEIVPDLRLTISIGLAHGPMGRIRDLIEAADDALYVAKQSGRNRVVTADPLAEGGPDGDAR